MSLPPGFLDELRTRLTLSQVVGRKVTWDMRKSNMAKGDFWAPCPFHQERTASFHVDDRKGFYYCFGCHAKGDALTFLREAENLGFMEAVELLAREAGMPVPAQDPRAQEKADRRSRLIEVVERAVRFYRMQLASAQGSAARAYLDRRRLAEPGRARFEIGFAPDGRRVLFEHLTRAGVPVDLIVDAGLAIRPEDGGAPFDRFRNRIIFPIRDGRGRAISLGGRAMDPKAPAKYLNGPQTEIFDKGHTLYNLAMAREAMGRDRPLIVAEGYMDVIALAEAGFEGAVAPLGTAITPEQLELMWRLSPEPVITLDGDAAGLRAAMRLVDLALPLIGAGRALRFCLMPGGQDPDELILAAGAAAMQAALDAAEPMVRLLWRRETEGQVFDSPERRAALDKALHEALGRIRDPGLRGHYEAALKDLKWQAFRGPAGPRGGGQRARRGGAPPALPAAPTPELKGSLLGRADAAGGDLFGAAVVLATFLAHPVLIREFEHELERLPLSDPGHRRLRDALLRHAEADTAEEIRRKIDAEAAEDLEKLFALGHVRDAPAVQDRHDVVKARMCLAEGIPKLGAPKAAEDEIAHAMEDLAGVADEGVTWRLSQAAEARARAGRVAQEDSNDLGEDRAALSARLQAMIDAQVWVKKRG